MTDRVEFEWLNSRFNFTGDDVIIDVGCGTGRHVQMFSQFTDVQLIIGCDFISKNIDYLNQEARSLGNDNVRGIVCNGVDFADHVGVENCSHIIGIGLVQYLVSDEELMAFANCCDRLLEPGGSVILKHPLACVESYVLDYLREEMETRYIAKYYDLNELMIPFLGRFELMEIERTFTENNVGATLLEYIEKDERARQMWIHLVKK